VSRIKIKEKGIGSCRGKKIKWFSFVCPVKMIIPFFKDGKMFLIRGRRLRL